MIIKGGKWVMFFGIPCLLCFYVFDFFMSESKVRLLQDKKCKKTGKRILIDPMVLDECDNITGK